MEVSNFVGPLNIRAETERQECEWLLTSGVLGRSGNLARVLKYICEEYFQGKADQTKEYPIAVEALGRRSDFDPHTDPIVRVTVHSLRKRLIEIYQNEGQTRTVRLVIPPGHYAPSFVHRSQTNTRRFDQPEQPSQENSHTDSPVKVAASTVKLRRQGLSVFQAWTVAGILLTTASVATWFGLRERKKERLAHASISANWQTPLPQASIHALMGNDRAPYVDHSGNTWTTANYCANGINVNIPSQRIEGTEDAPLYFGGVRGIAHCVFPVNQGLYELHFYFSETSDIPIAKYLASLSINAAPAFNVDVVDNAGGHSTATSTIVSGVASENDGSIHLDFISEVSLLNAIEILPAPSARQLPVRIVASSSSYTDAAKQISPSDRYFSGGRHGLPPKVTNIAELGIYQSSRIGRFRYNIPAVPFARYRVKLYFREPWFGKENGGIGGPGSRIFNVACNGMLLMKNFDIVAEGGSKPIMKTFENVQATAGGRIELYFMPIENYPVVNAIEVQPED